MKILDLTQPDVRPIKESGEFYELASDYRFEFEYRKSVFHPKIRKGFKYDGASVPRIVWTLIGFLPDGIHRPAALVHDWLYEGRGDRMIDGGHFLYDRKFADKFFLECLKHVGVKSWHARLAYLAVRAFGNMYWRK